MAIPSNSYWGNRAEKRMATYHRSSDRVMAQINTAYNKGQANVLASAERMLGKFAKDGGLTPDEAVKILNQPITKQEWNEIKEQYKRVKDPEIRRQLLTKLNAPAYAARISRQQAIQADMLVQSKLIADAELALSTSGYTGLINDAYNRTMFDLHKGVGLAFDFAAIPKKRIEVILKRPWSGMHYSNRIWHNTDVLASTLSEVVTGGFKSGASLREMRREVEDRMQVSKHAANRLLRTETTYMANAAEMESYEEADIDRYRFIATLDNRTSEQCRNHDNKIYAVKDARPGYNMPPLHPYCRSTTIAVISGRQESGLQRRAVDPSTGKSILVPASMSYKQWHKKYVEKAA